MTDPTVAPWLRARAALSARWWVYVGVAAIGGLLFARSLSVRDPSRFAVFALLPILALRQAWTTARRIGDCDRRLSELSAYNPASPNPELFVSQTTEKPTETATFAAGCFWGVEELFRRQPGVVATRVGYTSGKTVNPTYEQVCTDRTGHAEAIEVTFDPTRISYGQLVDLFFENHDPTTLNRQGPDVGTQYRSGIYYHSPEQQQVAEADIEKRQASGDYPRDVVTEVEPASTFYSAEDYHQKYFMKRGMNHACHFGNGKRLKAAAAR